MKRGYKPAISQSDELKATVGELNAFSDLIPDLQLRIDITARSHRVTRAELKRNYGYSNSALRLLEKSRILLPINGTRSRPVYDLAKALRIRAVLPAFLMAKRVRTVRKGRNITTILHEFLNEITEADGTGN